MVRWNIQYPAYITCQLVYLEYVASILMEKKNKKQKQTLF